MCIKNLRSLALATTKNARGRARRQNGANADAHELRRRFDGTRARASASWRQYMAARAFARRCVRTLAHKQASERASELKSRYCTRAPTKTTMAAIDPQTSSAWRRRRRLLAAAAAATTTTTTTTTMAAAVAVEGARARELTNKRVDDVRRLTLTMAFARARASQICARVARSKG